MNILIVSQYFYPENFRINDLANELKNRGHKIVVLTGTPNYPNGKFFNGYGIFKKTKENYNGINIIRSPLIPRVQVQRTRLAFNYVSFVFGAVFKSFGLLNSKNRYNFCF